MSTLQNVGVQFIGDDVMVHWTGEDGAAMSLTANRTLVESGDLGNVSSALVEEIRTAIDGREDWGRGEYDR